MSIYEQISKTGIIPVVTVKDAESALLLSKALLEGGLRCAEFTFRTEAAESAIKLVSKELPTMLIGAGTVLSTEQVDRAISAGASFIVSPGINEEVVRYCQSKDIVIFPGVATASEIDLATRLGLGVVKYFPAETSGGLANLKALSAPFPKMKFIPTGGVNANNLNNYLSFNKVLACGGSWMVSSDLVKGDNYTAVTETTKKAIDTMLNFSFAHLGINEQSESDADSLAKFFCDAFSLEYIMKVPSIFAGVPIEIMKNGGKGKNGHIGFYTNSVERAIYALEARGYTFDSSTARVDENNNRTFIYFDGEFGGFSIHLVER